jgi:hypothetical protein
MSVLLTCAPRSFELPTAKQGTVECVHPGRLDSLKSSLNAWVPSTESTILMLLFSGIRHPVDVRSWLLAGDSS